MKPLISRRSAATTLIVFASLFASLLIGSALAESASKHVTNADSDLSPRSLAVSNGRIAFGGNTIVGMDTRDEVFVMDPDGSNETTITSLGGLDPSYSPDGTKLLLVADATTCQTELIRSTS